MVELSCPKHKQIYVITDESCSNNHKLRSTILYDKCIKIKKLYKHELGTVMHKLESVQQPHNNVNDVLTN